MLYVSTHCLCELVLCNLWVTLPPSLLFSNPSCMGQRMERASIWAPSPAYLLDTQVGTVHSSPLRLLRPLTLPATYFFCTMLVDITVCSVFDMAWLPSWNTSFSHMGASHVILLCCTVCVCVCRLGPLSVPYHTVCCSFIQQGCQWIVCVCILLFTLLAFYIVFFLHHKSSSVFLLKQTNSEDGFLVL